MLHIYAGYYNLGTTIFYNLSVHESVKGLKM